MKRLISLLAVMALLLSCLSGIALGEAEKKYTETEMKKDKWIKVEQEGGPTLGYSAKSGVTILEVDGLAFKDLDKDGELDVYEDWRLDADTRARDLAAKLTIEQIAGLRYTAKDPGADADAFKKDEDEFVRHFLGNALARSDTGLAVEAVNEMQVRAETAEWGVPVIVSMDPPSGMLQQTQPLSLGATFDTELVTEVYNTAAKLMRSMGVFEMLGTQADMATEPRWSRAGGTFGEDPALVRDMVKASVTGLQSTFDEEGNDLGWGADSVISQVKHFPGDGAAEGGRESHQAFGMFNVYPGEAFATATLPFFDGAFNLDSATETAGAVMPSYSIAWSEDEEYGELVGSNFSEYKINLLRENGFDGIISTDSLIMPNNPMNIPTVSVHGMDGKTTEEVVYQIIKISIDRILMPDFGEEISFPQKIVMAYEKIKEEDGEEAAEKNFRDSAVRLLRAYIRTGAFENPYAEAKQAKELIDKSGITSGFNIYNQKSIVMLKNSGSVIKEYAEGTLPTVYIPMNYSAPQFNWMTGATTPGGWNLPVNEKFASQYVNIVTDKLGEPTGENGAYTENDIIRASEEELAACDFAVVFISNPASGDSYNSETGEYYPVTLQYREYVADGDNVREESISQRVVETVMETPYGPTTTRSREDRSYYGNSNKASNEGDLDLVLDVAERVTCPVVVCVTASNAMIFGEFEDKVDAILIGFGESSFEKTNFLPIIGGKLEPYGLLPIQMPKDMDAVEAQYEDVPRDAEVYVDADGNAYDFTFGLNWSGKIEDERVAKYNVPALTEPETVTIELAE